MLRCEHCKVDLPGSPTRCPLCQNRPVGTPDGSPAPFPVITPAKPVSRLLLTWLAFGSVCAAAICATINLILPSGGWWSLFVAAGLASLWVDFAIFIKKRDNLPKSMIWQAALISIIALLWDLLTGWHRWSIDYVLPILSSSAMLAMIIYAKVRRLEIQDYLFYLVIACVLGLVSFIMLLAGAVRVVIPSAVTFGISVIFLAFLLFFEGKALLEEIQRRFHL